MAYERQSDSTKADQNTRVLADSLDAAVNGAIATFKTQVAASDAVDENNFQSLVAAGNMSLPDQLAYRKAQLSRTGDPDTRAAIRKSIATLGAQVTQKNFADGYTKQLQDNAAGIESIDSVISWLRGQLASTTDTTVADKINSELTTQEGNRFVAVQKTLSDQTTYAQKSGNMTTINNQITSLASAKSKALLDGDTQTAANLDLQIQSLQQFVAETNIVTTIQHLATSTVTGSSSATNLLDGYQGQISGADTTTPVTINGTTYPSAQAFWTQARESYVADTSASGFFSRVAKESTDSVNVKASNNTLSVNDIKSINNQFATLSANPILAPFTAQLATAKQTALQAAADALAKVVENKFDQSLDLNTALNALSAIAAQGANVDDTTQKVLNSAAQTQSQTVSNIMTAAQNLLATNPELSITQAVNRVVASGAGNISSPDSLLSKTPAQTVIDEANAAKAGASAPNNSTTINGAPGTADATPTTPAATPAQQKSYVIKQGDTLSQIAAANNTTVAALAAANKIANPDLIQAGATIVIPSAAVAAPLPSATPAAPAIRPQTDTTTGPSAPTPPPTTINAGGALGTLTLQSDGTYRTTANAYGNYQSFSAQEAQQKFPSAFPTQAAAPTVGPALQASQQRAAAASAPASTPAPAPVSPAPTPATQPTSTQTAAAAAAKLYSSDPYNPPAGLSSAKTNQGGSAYSDKNGNLYVQSSPGVYTLNNSLK